MTGNDNCFIILDKGCFQQQETCFMANLASISACSNMQSMHVSNAQVPQRSVAYIT